MLGPRFGAALRSIEWLYMWAANYLFEQQSTAAYPLLILLKEDAYMLCPHCKVELKLSERKNIEIDYCPQCRGVWLDRGELDKMIEASGQYNPEVPSMKRRERDDDDDDHRRYSSKYKSKSLLKEIFDF